MLSTKQTGTNSTGQALCCSESQSRAVKHRLMLKADHVCQFLISPAVLDLIPFLVTNESTAALRFYVPSPIDVPLPFKPNAFVVQCHCRKNTTALSFDMTPRPRRVPHPSKLYLSSPRATPSLLTIPIFTWLRNDGARVFRPHLTVPLPVPISTTSTTEMFLTLAAILQ